jgi:NitT/TauT family transport system permease protein
MSDGVLSQGRKPDGESRGSFTTLFDRAIVVILLLGIWKVGSLQVGPEWVSSPELVALEIWNWFVSGSLYRHAIFTLQAAILGFLIGGIPGAVLPFLIRRMPFVVAVIEPFMLGGYAIPKLALTPVLVIWFGIGLWSKVALVASVSFFLLFFNAMAGIRSIQPQLVRMAEIVGADNQQVSRLIVFPATIAFIFTGIRVSLPLSIGGAAIAEMISSNRGLGYLIQLSATNFDATGSFAGIVVLGTVVALTNLIVDFAEQRLLAWKPKADDALREGLPS